ncbi:MAG TPA: 30S ribosomal protein S2 [Candidatus Fraserbacteria bacterium]|nr:30S ribosomal protein S2 [Candidatus Fraserbacteria bacterium]
MQLLTIKELLETGVHFGHRVRKWNPKMASYIFTKRKGIHIIDLQQTIRLFSEAYGFVRDSSAKGKEILFVGTKRQVQETIEQEAKRCGAHYVNRRWLGGTITNFPTIAKRIERMKALEEMAASGAFEQLPNKEVVNLKRELGKLQRNLAGIRYMTRTPDLLYVIDPQIEANAVHEANLLKIPVVAIIDTNCDPAPIDYPIPGNDDAIKATRLISSRIADAVLEGREGQSQGPAAASEETTAVTEATEAAEATEAGEAVEAAVETPLEPPPEAEELEPVEVTGQSAEPIEEAQPESEIEPAMPVALLVAGDEEEAGGEDLVPLQEETPQ